MDDSHVLLVEDHPDMREVLVEILQMYGYQVNAVGSVAEAIEAAKDRFDVLISDMNLPDGTAVELLSRLEPGHEFRSICLTGYGEEFANASREAGFDLYLSKPVSPDQLQSAISKLMER